MESYLESYKYLIKDLDILMSQKINNKLQVKYKETPKNFLLEKNGVKLYDIDRPIYGLLTQMIQIELNKLKAANKKYRTLVYSFIYDVNVEHSFEEITKLNTNIAAIKSKVTMLNKLKDTGKLYMLIKKPSINLQPNDISEPSGDTEPIQIEPTIVKNKVKIAASTTKIGKISKKSLKESLTVGKISESDMKVFLFKTLKECIARPSSGNNSLSKAKMIDKMLENPNLKKMLPPSYANKKKEELCKILFPGSD